MRQGNQNAELGIIRYVVERSFDGYSWQTVQRKAEFIAQIMRGRLDVREIEDIGDTAMSASEAKALSSGNPLLLEKANADNDLARLQRLERAHHRNLTNLGHARAIAAARITQGYDDVELLQKAAVRARPTAADAFTMTVADTAYGTRTEAVQAIVKWATEKGLRYAGAAYSRNIGTLGTLGGFDVEVSINPGLGRSPVVSLSLTGVPRSSVVLPRDELMEGSVGLVRQLENRAAGFSRTITEIQAHTEVLHTEVAEADARLQLPFKYQDDLAAATTRAAVVSETLAAAQRAATTPPTVDAGVAPLAAARAARRPGAAPTTTQVTTVTGPSTETDIDL